MANRRFHLLIIDPQNDFCDLPEDLRRGNMPALPVSGAHADMLRLAALIEQGGAGIAEISVTFDSHQRLDIAHPGFWRQDDGSPPAPFTLIRAADVKAGKFRPRRADALSRVMAYLEALEAARRYTHMVWPVHCELGSWGHNAHAAVRRAYNQWEEASGNSARRILKGQNPWTEQYSAIRAEAPDAAAPDTGTNTALLARLGNADEILVAGEAGSHCVKATVEDIAAALPAERLTLLVDCMSPVAGFADAQQGFFDDMNRCGARIATSADILPELRANAGEDA
ncbi:MAG: cysteine hydrolase [Zoogloeaceae bacterium]|nr:cysteine hydrolase [Zoogloeaceae bacterium]